VKFVNTAVNFNLVITFLANIQVFRYKDTAVHTCIAVVFTKCWPTHKHKEIRIMTDRTDLGTVWLRNNNGTSFI